MPSTVQRTCTNHLMGEEILIVTLQIDQQIFSGIKTANQVESVSECVVAANWERKSFGVVELYGN